MLHIRRQDDRSIWKNHLGLEQNSFSLLTSGLKVLEWWGLEFPVSSAQRLVLCNKKGNLFSKTTKSHSDIGTPMLHSSLHSIVKVNCSSVLNDVLLRFWIISGCIYWLWEWNFQLGNFKIAFFVKSSLMEHLNTLFLAFGIKYNNKRMLSW